MRPTAARSRVGTSWIASSGRPASRKPVRQGGVDRARRAEALGAAAQDRRVARLEAERAGVRGHVRPALVDHADDAERHAHALDRHAVRARPAIDDGADRIGQRATTSRPLAIAATRLSSRVRRSRNAAVAPDALAAAMSSALAARMAGSPRATPRPSRQARHSSVRDGGERKHARGRARALAHPAHQGRQIRLGIGPAGVNDCDFGKAHGPSPCRGSLLAWRAGLRQSAVRPMSDVRIGTSGWHYDSWWGPSFPEDLRKKDALRYTRAQFNGDRAERAVLPHAHGGGRKGLGGADARMISVFAWKASKFITHWRAAEREVDEQHRAAGLASQAARPQGRTGAVPAAAAV